MQWLTENRGGVPIPELSGCIATIGVFDGVHLGHRAILDRTLSWARTVSKPAVVITFAVHPDLIVRGVAPPLLMSLDHRRLELERAGIDACLVLDFDQKLMSLSAADFVQHFLCETLNISGLVLGHDTAVGKDRRGDARYLDALGAELGFDVKVVGEISVDGTVVSSTRIRRALKRGDLEQAAKLLGRAPSVLGTVVPGEQRGRSLGFPTANLEPVTECIPAEGVYAVYAIVGSGDDAKVFKGLCNLGRRPTFHERAEARLEVHLLDFEGDLYGRQLEVVFLSRLRGEQKFSAPAELIAQIEKDRNQAEAIFRDGKKALATTHVALKTGND